MKLAISATGSDMEDRLDPRFGRCDGFAVGEVGTGDWTYVPNLAATAGGGAATQAVQALANRGVGAVISGEFGPRATDALGAAGIRAYTASDGSVKQLVERYRRGELEPTGGDTQGVKGNADSSAASDRRRGLGFGFGRGRLRGGGRRLGGRRRG